jgi:iron(III) transport system ATP-binding protein
MSPLLEIRDLAHQYDSAPASTFHDISLSINEGEIFCLLGPSGCGKTTLLHAIAGFEQPTMGAILHKGADLTPVAPEKRNIGFVFQDYALFPHLSVEKNIAFSLQSMPADQRRIHVHSLLKSVGLEEHAQKFPHELSGGEQQRVAIARALARSPNLILLDEPFSNLDVDRRRELRQSLRQFLKNAGITAIFVTHDQEEAYEISDRIGVLHEGVVHQVGTPEELYQTPKTEFVARFLGSGLFLPVKITGLNQCSSPIGTLTFPIPPLDYPIGSDALLYVPRQSIMLDHNQGNFDSTIIYRRYRGESWSYDLVIDQLSLTLRDFISPIKWEVGTTLKAHLELDCLKILLPKS